MQLRRNVRRVINDFSRNRRLKKEELGLFTEPRNGCVEEREGEESEEKRGREEFLC